MENRKKTGLVLEGGGMRGIYTAGVLDAFMERRITFDGVIGVSAGAIHGCSFVSNQKGRSIRYYKKYYRDKRFMSYWNFFRTGNIVDEKFCYHDLPEVLDPYDYDAFQRSKTEFYVTCTNVETGKAEYIKMEDMRTQIDCMRASASLPYVSKIVEAEGKKLLDGGCADSIPVKAFMDMGFERNVVVLTREKGYMKKEGHSAMARRFYRRYPEFAKTLESRPRVYNETIKEIERLEAEGKIFVIRPSKALTIGRMSHDGNEIIGTYETGYQDAKSCLDELISWYASGSGEAV